MIYQSDLGLERCLGRMARKVSLAGWATLILAKSGVLYSVTGQIQIAIEINVRRIPGELHPAHGFVGGPRPNPVNLDLSVTKEPEE